MRGGTDHAFGLQVLSCIELMAEVDQEGSADGLIQRLHGCWRIVQPEQVFVEPAQLAIGKGADLGRADDIGQACGNDFETPCEIYHGLFASWTR